MGQKILIADDDEDLVLVLRDLLDSQGYETLASYEGIQTLEVAVKNLPDLILLDWRMPSGKGSAVLDMLSEKDQTKNIPVIILSGIEEPGMKELAVEKGVLAFVKKPYETKELLSLIEKILKTKNHHE